MPEIPISWLDGYQGDSEQLLGNTEQLEIVMNIEQALNAADESETEGLCGLYPTAAQVLAAEVRYLRERVFMLRNALANLEGISVMQDEWMRSCINDARRVLRETPA